MTFVSAEPLRPAIAIVSIAATLAISALAQAAPPAPARPDPSIRTIADISSRPPGNPAHGGSWSPDSRAFTFLAADSRTAGSIGKPGDIIQIDAATGHASILATQAQLAALSAAPINEKDRDHRSRYNMSAFRWADDSRHLMLDNGGRLWLYDIAAGTGAQIVDTGAGSGDDPKFSPDAHSVSYIRNHNLYVHPVDAAASTPEIPLTSTTAPTMLNGEVDWVYLEELEGRSNYFWSPDSAAIAYLQMDEEKVPQFPLADWIPTHTALDQQRYPQPGDPNPAVRVGVVSAKGGPTRWVELPFSPGNDYIPRFGWVDANTVYVEVLTRDHQHLNLYFADAGTGQSHLVYTATDDKYLDDNYDVTLLPHGRFLTTSWRDGHTHLYLYQFDEHHPPDHEATLVRQLTSGEFEVRDVQFRGDTVFYLSNEGSLLESSLWSIQLDGTGKRRITSAPGTHDINLAPDGHHFTDVTSNATTQPTVSLCAVPSLGSDASRCADFWHATPVATASKVTPTRVTFTAADGKTKLYGILTLPADSTAAASVPLILNPYGGPGEAIALRNTWRSGQIFDDLLAQHGFAVLTLENRGMGGRGRDFQQAAFRNLGPVQLSDQLAALDQTLAVHPELDPHRIGWWGWSWGGSFTLYAMTHSDRIRAGVAVAPVSDWRNYDSVYTERYMGLPAANAATYTADAPITSAAKLKGRLLIAHGTGDDNVHLANTIQFIQPLIDAGIPYDLQLFPRKTHSIAGPTAQAELFTRILTHFETYLK